MFKELLDFDEVCFEGAVVEEERRVGAGGQVFELGWLPGAGGREKMEREDGGGGHQTLLDVFIQFVQSRSLSRTSKRRARWLSRLSEQNAAVWIDGLSI